MKSYSVSELENIHHLEIQRMLQSALGGQVPTREQLDKALLRQGYKDAGSWVYYKALKEDIVIKIMLFNDSIESWIIAHVCIQSSSKPLALPEPERRCP